MKRAYILSGLIAVALAANAGTAMARGDGPGFGGPKFDFTAADADKDGKLTKDEITAYGAARFSAADTDGDGALDAAEMAARIETQMQQSAKERAKMGAERMIERRDADKDGKVTMDEMMPKDGGAKMFSRLDKDGDGAISSEEFASMQQRFEGRGEGGHGKWGHGGRHEGGRHGHGDKKGHHKDGAYGERFMKKPVPSAPAEEAPQSE